MIDRERAFMAGVQRFCKSAGLDNDDTDMLGNLLLMPAEEASQVVAKMVLDRREQSVKQAGEALVKWAQDGWNWLDSLKRGVSSIKSWFEPESPEPLTLEGEGGDGTPEPIVLEGFGKDDSRYQVTPEMEEEQLRKALPTGVDPDWARRLQAEAGQERKVNPWLRRGLAAYGIKWRAGRGDRIPDLPGAGQRLVEMARQRDAEIRRREMGQATAPRAGRALFGAGFSTGGAAPTAVRGRQGGMRATQAMPPPPAGAVTEAPAAAAPAAPQIAVQPGTTQQVGKGLVGGGTYTTPTGQTRQYTMRGVMGGGELPPLPALPGSPAGARSTASPSEATQTPAESTASPADVSMRRKTPEEEEMQVS